MLKEMPMRRIDKKIILLKIFYIQKRKYLYACIQFYPTDPNRSPLFLFTSIWQKRHL